MAVIGFFKVCVHVALLFSCSLMKAAPYGALHHGCVRPELEGTVFCLQDANSADAKAFEKAAEAIDDVPFAMALDEAVHSKFEVSKDSVVLFKKVIAF